MIENIKLPGKQTAVQVVRENNINNTGKPSEQHTRVGVKNNKFNAAAADCLEQNFIRFGQS